MARTDSFQKNGQYMYLIKLPFPPFGMASSHKIKQNKKMVNSGESVKKETLSHTVAKEGNQYNLYRQTALGRLLMTQETLFLSHGTKPILI